MFQIILSVLFFIVGIWFVVKPPGDIPQFFGRLAGAAFIILGLCFFASLSFVYVESDEIGTLDRVYMADDLAAGKIIAANGEKGPQSRILGPGFHVSPFIRFLYVLDFEPLHEVPEGQYGVLVARDGMSLREGQYLADAWPANALDKMLDGTYFLNNGGQKGPQLNVLKPAKYRYNTFLWKITNHGAIDVATGTVAVIKSNVQTASDEVCSKVQAEGETGGTVSTPIVPRGCIGVWDEPLMPNRYYLNVLAYTHTIIPTRLITWAYKGGYMKREITVSVNAEGTITQKTPEPVFIPRPEGAADDAITVRTEGWEFPVEVRAVVQVHPRDAPRVVASVGTLADVEDRIVTPTIRDVLRTIGGAKGRKVLDFVEKRDEIVAEAEKIVAAEAAKAGVTLQELRLGEAAIPPELMVATLRKQLATQLILTYKEEKLAQKERIAVEKERAEADQQEMLVTARMKRDAAKFTRDREKTLGEGEKLRMMEVAEGQKAQRDILGPEIVAQLKLAEMVLAAAVANPAIVKVPTVLVQGADGGGITGAAAVLGSSNIVKMLTRP